jgi:hypothetical protein
MDDTKQAPDPQSPQSQGQPKPDPRRPAMIGLLLLVALILGGLFLVHVLRAMSHVQDCAMEGRTNCAPIDASGSGG